MPCPINADHDFFACGPRPFCWKCAAQLEKALIKSV